MSGTVQPGNSYGFCANTANIWQIAGYIKKATKSLAFRALAGVLIFFIPTIVSVIIGMVSNFADSGAQEDYNVCRACLTNPYDGECDSYAQDAWNGGA